MRTLLLIGTAILLMTSSAHAQQQTPPPSPTPSPSPSPATLSPDDIFKLRKMVERYDALTNPALIAPALAAQGLGSDVERKSPVQANLGWGVLGFGAVVLLLVIAVVWKVNKGFGPLTFRIFGLTLVIISGLFLIVTGYSQEQIAPMFALLGTIAGFIFGKASAGTKDKDEG